MDRKQLIHSDPTPSLTTVHYPLIKQIRHLRSRLISDRPRREFGIAIGRVLLDGEPREIHADAVAVNGAVRQTAQQGVRDGGLEVLAPGRARAGDVLIAADEVVVAKVVRVDALVVALGVGRAEVGGGLDGAVRGAVLGHAAVDAVGAWGVAREGGVREAVGVGGCGAVKVGDCGAAVEEIAVFEAFGEGVGVGGISVVADEIAAAFGVVWVAEYVDVDGVVGVDGGAADGSVD